MVPPMLGCWRSAWMRPSRSAASAAGRTSASHCVVFPVDDDSEVRLTHVGHRHCTSMLCTEECCQIGTRRGGKIADQAWAGRSEFSESVACA